MVYKKGNVLSNKAFTLIFVRNNFNTAKFGFNISGKYGNAVKRNKLRRQLKAVCSEFAATTQAGFYVLRPRFYACDAPTFEVLKNSVKELFDRVDK